MKYEIHVKFYEDGVLKTTRWATCNSAKKAIELAYELGVLGYWEGIEVVEVEGE